MNNSHNNRDSCRVTLVEVFNLRLLFSFTMGEVETIRENIADIRMRDENQRNTKQIILSFFFSSFLSRCTYMESMK